MTAQWQLNGLVMLYAYLQRVFVYDKAIATIPGADAPAPAPIADLPALLDKTSAAIRDFDTRAGLPDSAVTEFDAVLAIVGAAVSERTAHPGAPVRERLAAVAGDRFHGRHLVEGLVYWGDRYNPEVADRYRQQVLPARNATSTLSRFVAAAANNALTTNDLAQVDIWYDEVVQAAGRLGHDMALTARLLHGHEPGP
ncbi:hypothetical protein [Nocardia sp. IFM 10818]